MIDAHDVNVALAGRQILDGVGFTVSFGESVAVTGPSGVGKTTLVMCLAGIRRPDTGTITIDDVNIGTLSASRRAAFRLRRIGIVFQFGELMPELSVADNVALPVRLAGGTAAVAREAAADILHAVGFQGHYDQHPGSLSGGETQRVAVARALVAKPQLILADEPTGSLDEAAALEIGNLLVSHALEGKAALVLVTHNPEVAALCDRSLRLRQGRLPGGTQPETVSR